MAGPIALSEKRSEAAPERLAQYEAFLDQVREHTLRERRAASRRLLSVFLWCFVAPVVTIAVFFLLSKVHMLPRQFSRQQDWLFLVFPTLYSLYFFGSEVVVGVPGAMKRGSLGNLLAESAREARWRTDFLAGLQKSLGSLGPNDWLWIAHNFRIDLRRMLDRTRYVSALGGAVFFLLVQGIDSLDMRPAGVGRGTPPIAFFEGWFEISTYNLSQFVSLSLFVVLLYLAGSRNHQSLSRYLDCVELLVEEQGRKP